MRKLKSLFVTVLVFAFMIGASVIQGGDTTETVHLRKGQLVAPSCYMERSCNNSYVLVKCNSVYPPSGTDNYKKIQCSLRSGSDLKHISEGAEYVVLTEGDGSTKIYVKEGSLKEEIGVVLYFRGNNPEKEAYASVTYNPM